MEMDHANYAVRRLPHMCWMIEGSLERRQDSMSAHPLVFVSHLGIARSFHPHLFIAFQCLLQFHIIIVFLFCNSVIVAYYDH